MKDRFIQLAMLLAVLASCTVKEDRTACPGCLEVGLDACRSMTEGVHLDCWNQSGRLFSQRVPVGNSGDAAPSFRLPKGEVWYHAYFGVLESSLAGNMLVIAEGSQMSPLYSYKSGSLVLGEDVVHDDVVPCKQFCDLQVLLSDEMLPRCASLMGVVTSSTGLVNMEDFSVGKGSFSVSQPADSLSGMAFRIPRQGFDDLKLSIFESGRLLHEYNLSSWLLEAGYDWQAESLADVTVRLGAEEVSGGVIIGDWHDGGTEETLL